jgi:CD109 antigen
MSFTLSLDQCFNYPSIQASYSDALGLSSWGYYSFNVFTTRDKEMISISLPDTATTITAGSTVRFLINSTYELSLFSYQLLSRDVLVKSELMSVSASTEHYLDIVIDAELSRKLAPSARLVVWFISSGGELVADSLDFSVVASTSSQVSVSLSSSTVQPGSTVTVTVRGGPNSFVGLLAVDKAAENAPGNDIKQEIILADRFSFHNESRCLGSPGTGSSRRKRDVVVTQSTAVDTSHVLFHSGVFVMTDAYVNNAQYWGDSGCPPLNNPLAQDNPNATIDTIVAGFLETWLWNDVSTGSTGTTTLQVTVPDHVTDWMFTAFAISPTTGLSVLSQPVNLTAIKSFFISANAPFVAIRGEEFGLQVTAHNLGLITPITTVITLAVSTAFKVRLPSSDTPQSVAAISTIVVPGASTETTTFWIVPVSLDQIQFELSAVGGSATDAITVKVIIQPEGISEEYSTSVSASPTGGVPFVHSFNVTLPEPGSLVPGSPMIIISAIGNFIGQTIDGLASLIQMPCGCGEQTMLGFAPDVYILKYLVATDKLTVDLERTLRTYITSGYQGELTYRHNYVDPYSFSAFGDYYYNWGWGNTRGSVWLSAFVVKCFHQAREFIPLSIEDISQTISWLISVQAMDGSFAETGYVCHVDMQGLAAGGKPLTAYVLIALLENTDNPQIGSQISASAATTVQYLENLLGDSSVTSDPYLMNLVCYALELAGSARIDDCLQALMALAYVSTADGMTYWQRANTECPWDYCWWYQPLAIDIEMTAYALLTYTHRQDVVQCAQISKWLLAQRNSNGGFVSTQDTVMALQALAEYAILLASSGGGQNLALTLTAGTFTHTFATITATNAMILQRVEIPAEADEIQCEASGTGLAIVQMTVKYHVFSLAGSVKRRRKRSIEGSSSEFLNVVANQEPISDTEIGLTACASWSGTTESGMVIMEIGVPTGYSANNPDQLRGQGQGRVKKVEVEETAKKLNLYIDELVAADTCVTVNLTKVLPVSNVQKARVIVYLYYNPGERSLYEYESIAESNTTHCDISPSVCQCNPPDYFSCEGNCFAASAKCNGVRECANGSDEVGCPVKVTAKPKCRRRCRALRRIRKIRARRRARAKARRSRKQ